MAALLLFSCVGAHALDVEAHADADGYRPGFWFPLRLTLSTKGEPFRGEVVVRLEKAQVHRVPLVLPAHARREVTVGILPFSPAVRVTIEGGEAARTLDLCLAPAAPERAEPVPADELPLYEGFRRVGKLHPCARAWGLTWQEAPAQIPTASPSMRLVWTRKLRPAPWGPSLRRGFLLALGGVTVALVGILAATRRRATAARLSSWALASAAALCGVHWMPSPRPAVSAVAFVGKTDGGRWQAQGFGCASGGADGDVVLSLPGVPRPVFEGLAEAQEASWGCVWGDRVQLVFPQRKAGEGCWFSWQSEASIAGDVVALTGGGVANETALPLAPAVLLDHGTVRLQESLPPSSKMEGREAEMPAPLTEEVLRAMDARWKEERLFLGGIQVALPGLAEGDLVQGRVYLWVPLD